ncbi:hypothetical protein DFP72DRAFT_879061 [Ephemerocybe angulata]|uniref:Uncharacterized protein n=1 Tax=Ephemerocybe angulata TaxID=980116 RepID=A0A8H6ID20_9AGAR|nr:hypothetical protein DFP72DRAFT_879061 [Tulosesus angulatus]
MQRKNSSILSTMASSGHRRRRSPSPELPTSAKGTSPHKPETLIRRVLTIPALLVRRVNALSFRRKLALYLSILVLAYLAYARRTRLWLLYTVTGIGQNEDDTNMNWPPHYTNVREWENNLPQHNLALPYPEGATGRYVKFSSQIKTLGWNNVFNELLLLTMLAQRTNRAYVFEDYVWKQGYYPWNWFKAFEVPSRTPLPALIAGPTAGGSWGPNSTSARSISDKWWPVVCPPDQVKVFQVNDMKREYNLYEKSATEIFEVWRKAIADDPARCIEVQGPPREVEANAQVFDLWLWGSYRILDIWEEFKKSDVSQLLATSPIVERVVDRNEHLFRTPQTPTGEDPFKRVFAVHARRGDFSWACQMLADWKSTFYSWNQLPFLPDRWHDLPGGIPGKNTPENVKTYFERCLPTKERLVERINNARDDYEREVFGPTKRSHNIDVLFLLSNDKTPWIKELRHELETRHGWKIVTSNDIVLKNAQEKDVGMAVDMDLGRKAAIFMGNGWSSYTSNIVHRRLVDGKIPMANRFF